MVQASLPSLVPQGNHVDLQQSQKIAKNGYQKIHLFDQQDLVVQFSLFLPLGQTPQGILLALVFQPILCRLKDFFILKFFVVCFTFCSWQSWHASGSSWALEKDR